MSGAGGYMNQVAPIEVHNPTEDEDDEDEPNHRCFCCGEGMVVPGMCVACANKDCSHHLEDACARTGKEDPLSLAVEDEDEFVGIDSGIDV